MMMTYTYDIMLISPIYRRLFTTPGASLSSFQGLAPLRRRHAIFEYTWHFWGTYARGAICQWLERPAYGYLLDTFEFYVQNILDGHTLNIGGKLAETIDDFPCENLPFDTRGYLSRLVRWKSMIRHISWSEKNVWIQPSNMGIQG